MKGVRAIKQPKQTGYVDRSRQQAYATILYRNMGIQRTSLNDRLERTLREKVRFGESREEAKKEAIKTYKKECRKQNKPFNLTNVRIEGIYSYNTFKNYVRCGSRFNDWLTKEKGIEDVRYYKSMINKYGVEYLKHMEERGLSHYSIAQMKAFMGKVLGREVEHKLPPQHEREITKGRGLSERFKSFNESANKDLVTIAKSTGGRRGDLERLRLKNFVVEKNVVIGVNFIGSKGGRDRFSPVIPTQQRAVTEIYERLLLSGKEKRDKVFNRVNTKANIHAYRREYARELYLATQKNPQFKGELRDRYVKLGHILKSNNEEYRTKDGRVFDRLSLFLTSQGLGHNRISVVTTNYFK